jgi:hypothetical protein
MVATDTHATTEELLEAVFSVRSVSGLYNDGQLPLWDSPVTAVRRAGGWCEMAASLRVSQSRERICIQSVGSCSEKLIAEARLLEATPKQRLVKTLIENTSLCVIVICKV